MKLNNRLADKSEIRGLANVCTHSVLSSVKASHLKPNKHAIYVEAITQLALLRSDYGHYIQ